MLNYAPYHADRASVAQPVSIWSKLPIKPLVIATHFALIGASFSLVNTAYAEPPSVSAISYDIPAGPLNQVLTRFASESGISLVGISNAARGQTSQGLQGSYSVSQGLEQLLQDTSLQVEQTDHGYRLVKRPRSVTELQTVVVRGQNIEADEIYTILGSQEYIGQKQAERFRGSSAADFLKGTAGVHTGDVRNGGALDVNIRGLQGQNRVPVIVDGTQQSIDVYRGYAGNQQRSYLDPDLISKVKIDKGPSMAADGAGAIGGAVRVTTLQAQDVVREGETVGVRVRGGMADNAIKPQDGFRVQTRHKHNHHTFVQPDNPGYVIYPDDGKGNDDHASHWPNHNSKFGSLAIATIQDNFELLGAYAYRYQGNYYAGKQGAHRFSNKRYSSGGTGMSTAPVLGVYPTEGEVLDTHSESRSILLKGKFFFLDDQSLELVYRDYDSTWGEIMPSMLSRHPITNQLNQFDPSKIRIKTYSLEHSFNPDNNLINLQTRVWHSLSRSRMYNANIGNSPYPDDMAKGPDPMNEEYRIGLLSEIRDTRYGLDFTNKSEFSNDYGDFNLTVGGAYLYQRTGPDSKQTEKNLNNNRFLRSGVKSEYSFVANLDWKPIDWLTLQAGGRYINYHVRDRNSTRSPDKVRRQKYSFARMTKDGQYFSKWPESWYMEWWADDNGDFTLDSLRNSPYANSTLGDHFDFDGYVADTRDPLFKDIPLTYKRSKAISRRGSDFSPQFGIAYHIDDDSQIYAKYTIGVKSPNIFESSLGSWTAAPTEGLKAEKNKVLELGVSTLKRNVFSYEDVLAAKLAWFKSDLHNMITRGHYPASDEWVIENIDRYRTEGLEMHLAYDQGRYYVDLSGSYYLKAQTCDRKTAERLREGRYGVKETPNCVDGGFTSSLANQTNPPKYTINTTIGARFLEKRNLEIGLRRVYNSGPTHELNERWHTYASTGNQLIYLSNETYDLFATYKPTNDLEMNLTVTNLTNQYYLDSMALSLMPAPGRTVQADFTWYF